VWAYRSIPLINVVALSKEKVDISGTTTGLLTAMFTGRKPMSPRRTEVGMARATDIARKHENENPPYLLGFTDGKVSSIKRQK
jgi:hypothetical protein